MDLRTFISFSMERARSNTLESVRGLGDEEYRWLPGPAANPICFLLLHVGRTEDRYFHRWLAGGGPQTWERLGLADKFGLPVDGTPAEVGNGWTLEQVRAFRYPSLAKTLEYLAAEREDTLRILATLPLKDLDCPFTADRPDLSPAYYLRAASLHEAAHQGAIDYLRGLFASRGR